MLVLGCLVTVASGRGTAASPLAPGGGRCHADGGGGGAPCPAAHRLHLRRPGGCGAGDVALRQDRPDRRRAAGGGPDADGGAARAPRDRDRSRRAHAPARGSSGWSDPDRPDVSMSGCSWTRRSVTTARSTGRCSRRCEARHVPVRHAERNRTIDIGGGATITLLTPPDPPIAHSRSDVNANSVIVRLDYGAVGVLFAADAEPQTERWLLTSGARLPAQVLKVAHHGGRYSSTAKFLRAVSPQAAVISVGVVNEYGHPTPEAHRAAGTGARPRLPHRSGRDGHGRDRRRAHRGDDGERQARDTRGKPMTPKATAPKTKTTSVFVDAVEERTRPPVAGRRRVHRPGGAAARRRWRRDLAEAVGDRHAAAGRSRRASPQARARRSGRTDQAVSAADHSAARREFDNEARADTLTRR